MSVVAPVVFGQEKKHTFVHPSPSLRLRIKVNVRISSVVTTGRPLAPLAWGHHAQIPVHPPPGLRLTLERRTASRKQFSVSVLRVEPGMTRIREAQWPSGAEVPDTSKARGPEITPRSSQHQICKMASFLPSSTGLPWATMGRMTEALTLQSFGVTDIWRFSSALNWFVTVAKAFGVIWVGKRENTFVLSGQFLIGPPYCCACLGQSWCLHPEKF